MALCLKTIRSFVPKCAPILTSQTTTKVQAQRHSSQNAGNNGNTRVVITGMTRREPFKNTLAIILKPSRQINALQLVILSNLRLILSENLVCFILYFKIRIYQKITFFKMLQKLLKHRYCNCLLSVNCLQLNDIFAYLLCR